MITNKYLILFIIIIIYFYIYVFVFREKVTEYLDQNWKDIRCQPYILPIAGLSNVPEGEGYFQKVRINFNKCTHTTLKTNLGVLTKPLNSVLKGFNRGISSIMRILNVFRNMAKVMREMFASLVENTMNRLKNSYGAMIYLQEKLKVMIKKQVAVFSILSQMLQILPFIFYSFANGPITGFGYWVTNYIAFTVVVIVVCLLCVFGGPFVKLVTCPICMVCFLPDTNIELENGRTRIDQIKVGQNIKDGKVLGVIKIKKDKFKIFNYKNTFATGDHLVFENEKWVRVKNSQNSGSMIKETELYCLITDNNKIWSNGNLFRDYSETYNSEVGLKVDYMITKFVNKNINILKTEDDIYHTYYGGFGSDTLVKDNDTIKPISYYIENGIPENSNIVGVIEIENESAINYLYKNVVVSGSVLVFEENQWIRVHQSEYSIDTNHQKTYNLITKNNIINVVNKNEIIKFRDFNETNDKQINYELDRFVQKHLNKIF